MRASVALEADLKNHDFDVCIVTETHLKLDQLDTVVNIADFNIYIYIGGIGTVQDLI